MAIFASPITRDELLLILQRVCTKTHNLMDEINSLDKVLSQYLDADIEAILGGVDAATERAAMRALQAALKGLADNYAGAGAVSDKSFEIAKRVRPTV